jgi:hypothetical protein
MDDATLSLIDKDLTIKLQTTLITLILEYEESKNYFLIQEFDFMKDVYVKITNKICIIENIAKKNNLEKENEIEELEKIRKDILDVGKEIKQYYNSLNIIDNRIIQAKNSKKELDIKNEITSHSLTKYCEEFIYVNKHTTCLKNKIVSCFPVKMSKLKYNEYINNAIKTQLSGLSKQQVNAEIEKYKAIFVPQINPKYKMYFEEVYDIIKELEEIDFKNITQDKLFEYEDKLILALEEYESIFSLLDILFTMTNSLIVLFSFTHKMGESILETNYIYKDLYYAVKESIDNKDDALEDIIQEALNSNCEELIETFNKNLIKVENKINKSSDNINLSKNKEFLFKFSICKTIQVVFLKNLEQSLYEESFIKYYFDFEEADNVYLEAKTKELIVYIGEKLQNISTKNKRVARKSFLNNFICPYSKEEFLNYTNEGFKISSDEEKQLILNEILHIFDIYGFRQVAKNGH